MLCVLALQDTLHEPPKAVVNMKRAVNTGMGCSLMFYLAVSITGYMALGDAVPGDILTGFTEPAGVVGAANVMVLLHMLPAYQVRVLQGSWGVGARGFEGSVVVTYVCRSL
jgi:amino acid permease